MKRNIILAVVLIIIAGGIYMLAYNQAPSPEPGPDKGILPYNSGIVGRVLLGPTCPVMKNPPDPNCADKGYQTNVSVYHSGNESVYATSKSGADGSFKFSLPPGDYRIEAQGGNMLPRCSPVEVTVGPSGYANQNISCDTGIR